MKCFFKGAAITAAILIVFIAVNMFCNMKGINLDSVSNGAVFVLC